MEEKKMTRRETMARLSKIIAMAAGVSTVQVSRLFGLEKASQTGKTTVNTTPVKKAPNIQKVNNVRARNEKVKILKVMLNNKRSVFETEFGRETPAYVVRDTKSIPAKYRDFLQGFEVKPGMMICGVEWIGADDVVQCDAGFLCGTNFISGTGAVAVNGSDDGCNLCNHGCGGEAHLMCPEQVCPGVNCGPSNYHNAINEYTTAGFYNQYQQDPYINALFQEFQVQTSQDLAQEVKSMLDARR